jgi:hypothetical protein
MKANFRTVDLGMHVLPYRGHRPDGITHCPDGFRRLPITMSWVRNPNACQTLNDVRTILPRRPDGCTWTLGSSRIRKSVRTICHYVWTDVNLNCSKLLDTDGRPDELCFDKWASGRNTTSFGRMLLTDERPDSIATSSGWLTGNWNKLPWKLHRIFLKDIAEE